MKKQRPGPEYDVLNAWAGDWIIQGEVKGSDSGPPHKLSWTLQGRRILGGFFLQIHTTWKSPGTVQSGLVVTGYDPGKRACFAHGCNDDGSWMISMAVFTDKRTCIETGSSCFPDGRVRRYRNTWSFGPDGKTLSVKGETERGGVWLTQFEAKGVKRITKARRSHRGPG